MQAIQPFRWTLILILGMIVVIAIALSPRSYPRKASPATVSIDKGFEWEPPNGFLLPGTADGDLILYGRDLIANTSHYLGPNGKVAATTNGMNCQNCHLEAGTKPWGNNYSGVYSTYPKFRARSGSLENIFKRINDCMERSLNGKSLDTNSREMRAIHAYLQWLGQTVPKGIRPASSGLRELPYLDRAADPVNGQAIYVQQCQRCHGIKGEGMLEPGSSSYLYPPLWGDHSYNIGAGLYRLSRLAGYVKYNMPFDNKEAANRLSDEAAWDVAAFINEQPRPWKDLSKDWPDISGKPIDHPFGPYTDSFSERQHKYGPFRPIAAAKIKK